MSSPLVGAPLGKTLFRLAVPGVAGSLIFSGLSLAEAAFLTAIGTILTAIGTNALAAVAIVFPLVMLAAMFSAGAIGGAVSGRTARALGAGDHSEASAILVSAVVISIAGGALMCVLVLLLGPAFYHWAANDSSVARAASHYAAIVFPAMPMFWLLNMLCSVMRGVGDMVRPMIVAAVMLLAYTVFAWAWIPRSPTELDVAIRAAALAMISAYAVALLVAVFFIRSPAQPVRFELSSFNVTTLRGILKQGLLASSQSVMTICYALVTTVLFARFGTDWLAGFGLAVRLELIMVPVIFGMGASMIAIVGAYVGAGQRRTAISIAWKGILANAFIVGLVGMGFALYPEVWCGPLGSHAIVVQHCALSVSTVGPTYLFFALGLGGYFASQGLNTLTIPVLGASIRLAIVATGLVWVTSQTPPSHVLILVVTAVICYGLFVVGGLKLGPWRISAAER